MRYIIHDFISANIYCKGLVFTMQHIPIFAFDFSMNKPAMSCIIDNKISFYTWPLSIDKVAFEKLESAGICICNRNLDPIKDNTFDESSLILEHVSRSTNLAKLIVDTLLNIIKDTGYSSGDALIANEGFAFAAVGDAVLDLSGYKYILMKELIDNGFRKFVTYSPITIKSTAGCSKKGMKKEDMIAAIGRENKELHRFIQILGEEPELLKKKTAFVQCTDDLTDAYWCLKTAVKKEGINCILHG